MGVGRLLLLNAIRRKPQQPGIAGKHTERYVVVKDGEIVDDLFGEGEPARNAEEFGLCEEAVIEAHAPADAETAARETEFAFAARAGVYEAGGEGVRAARVIKRIAMERGNRSAAMSCR